jgi:hypothetical protein
MFCPTIVSHTADSDATLERIALRVPTIYTSEFHSPPNVIFGWLYKHS